MLDLIKKSILIGAGVTYLTADKMKAFLDAAIRESDITEREAREAVKGLAEKSENAQHTLEEKKKKILNEAFAFWLYGDLSGEIEERLEKAVTLTLQQLRIPCRDELEEIQERIARLEKELEQAQQATGNRQ
jgi:polyhydroxyalkanoate synthesis regulator phasin